MSPCITLSNKATNQGYVEQSRERSSTLPLHLGVVAIKKEAFWSHSTTVCQFIYYIYIYIYIFKEKNKDWLI